MINWGMFICAWVIIWVIVNIIIYFLYRLFNKF